MLTVFPLLDVVKDSHKTINYKTAAYGDVIFINQRLGIMKYIFGLLLLSVTGIVQSAQISGHITSYRTFPEAQSVAAARNHVVFDIDKSLSPACDAVYLPPESTTSISLVLAAKMANLPIKLTYTEEGSPWHARTCAAVEVSL